MSIIERLTCVLAKMKPIPKTVLSVLVRGSVLLLGLVSWSQAYTVVVPSTSAPQGIEQTFIAATTTQFEATLFVNPLFAGTYQIQLLGPNPAYNPPVTDADLLQALVTIDSYTYVYGWADGMRYERGHDLGYFTAPAGQIGMPNGGFFVNCSSAPYFNVPAIDSTTCQGVLATVYNFIYQQNFSTPTVVPGF